MKKKAKIMAVVLTLMLLTSVITGVHADEDIQIVFNGEEMNFDVTPVIESGRVLVPFAHLFRILGAEVTWNAEDRSVIGEKEGISIHLEIDSREAFVNGERVELDVPARIISDRTMVPLRFASENMGATVEWNGETRIVTIVTVEEDFQIRHLDFDRIDAFETEMSEELSSWYETYRETAGFHTYHENGWIYVLAAAGEKPTGGFSLRVLTVSETATGEIFVEAELEIPAPGDMVTQALTYPHSLIRFEEARDVSIDGSLRELTPDMQEVTLYFMEVTDTAFLATAEGRLVHQSEVTAENLMEELMKGPESEHLSRAIPEEVELRGVSLSEGVAYVDLSAEVMEVHLGAEAEAVLVHSIVWTLVQLPEVDAVQILVEGEVVETIAGHVSIDRPFVRE